MKAEEMFKDCGWEKQEERLAYWKTDHNGRWCISFLLSFGEFHCYLVPKKESNIQYEASFNMRELLAINQQCVELGWLVRETE